MAACKRHYTAGCREVQVSLSGIFTSDGRHNREEVDTRMVK